MMQPALLLTLALLAKASAEANTDFLWSSTGGGWRAMFACVGFANVFQQAGLFTENSSSFSSIATTSGASWFSTQLFYSQAFYNQTVLAESPSDLYDFTVTWMAAYASVVQDMDTMDFDINRDMANMADLSSDNEDSESIIEIISELFGLIQMFNGDWAAFVQGMLESPANAYGHQGKFSDIVASSENRLIALQNTDLVVQTALVPNSRVRVASAEEETRKRNHSTKAIEAISGLIDTLFAEEKDMAVFLGPPPSTSSDDNFLYTVALSAAYALNSTHAEFYYSTLDHNASQDADLMTYVASTSVEFELDNWSMFHLRPFEEDESANPMAKVPANSIIGTGGEPVTAQGNNGTMMTTGAMPLPFGGKPPTVIQLAAISSAVAGGLSPTAPSLFSQILSKQRELVDESRGFVALQAFDIAADNIYQSLLLDDTAVCSQWPTASCEANEGRFVDGGYVDNPAVAFNIASHQKSLTFNPNSTLKLVLTNTNQAPFNSTGQRSQVLQYFESEANENTPPGGFVWLPGAFSPIRSAQVFADFMTAEQLDELVEPMLNSSMTTTVLQGTTTDNSAFGIQAGQRVQIFLVNLNHDIPTLIATPAMIEQETAPLAAMVQGIAENQELVQRVRDFFFSVGEGNAEEGVAEGNSDGFSEVTKTGTTNLEQSAEAEGSSPATSCTTIFTAISWITAMAAVA